MRKDNVDLICSIGELAGLFEKSHSLEDFLKTVVSIVAHHMRAAVCSVYLYDKESDELVLTANQGLSEASLGKVRLRLGEGITGAALKELRPICESHGSKNPNFKFIPGIQEEQYEAFLAVPILRGLTRVGVLVLQDPVADYFDENDTKALLAIAAQLATTIENANLLMKVHQLDAERPPKDTTLEMASRYFVRGKPGAGGHASGTPTIFTSSTEAIFVEDRPEKEGFGTLPDFIRALELTDRQLEQLQRQLEEGLSDVASMIFSAHLLIVRDTNFSGQMMDLIRSGMDARTAIQTVVVQYIGMFANSTNARIREKVQDLKDLGHRLIHNLDESTDSVVDYTGHIIITGELLPSQVLRLSAQNAEGIIMVGGGMTAHVSLLARSLDLPLVITDDEALFYTEPNRIMLIDGEQGTIFIDPTDEVLEQYHQLEESRKKYENSAAAIGDETCTRDGERIVILANINMLNELETARKLKAEGVGLYRTEFPFIIRNSFPSEEEQFRIYRTLVEGMEGREVTLRTLDVGGDKMLSYFPGEEESNPFLGLRAIRFSLRYPDIFCDQLRAMLRATHDTVLRVMFPLVSSVDDFIEAREILMQCRRDLEQSGTPASREVKTGVMIELPAAVEIIEELAAEADFLSIGGNDLVQYILAVDRTNKDISDMYLSYHPAVLRTMSRIARAAIAFDRPLSFCGEMATDPRLLPFLIGIGIRKISIDPKAIPRVHQRIIALSASEAGQLAVKLLSMSRIGDIEKTLEDIVRTDTAETRPV